MGSLLDFALLEFIALHQIMGSLLDFALLKFIALYQIITPSCLVDSTVHGFIFKSFE